MTNQLSKLSLTDFFAFAISGLLLVASSILWIPLKDIVSLGNALLTTFVITGAYIAGQLLYSLNSLSLSIRQDPAQTKLKKILQTIYLIIVPFRAITESERLENLAFAQEVERTAPGTIHSPIPNVLELPKTLRHLRSAQADTFTGLIELADSYHRAFLLSLNVGLALNLLGFQLLLKGILLLFVPIFSKPNATLIFALSLASFITALLFRSRAYNSLRMERHVSACFLPLNAGST